MRAVIFDFWDTVAAWPHEDMSPLFDAVGLTAAEWAATDHRDRRWTGSLEAYLAWVGLDESAGARAVELRTAMTRGALVPMDGSVPVLEQLRSRGLRLGLVSNCSSEVATLWDESPFAGLFDATVFSAQVGVCKPDERIYRIALDALGVTSAEAVFVGDGDSGELAGAEAVGMRAVQLGSREGWDGERVETLGELLPLLD